MDLSRDLFIANIIKELEAQQINELKPPLQSNHNQTIPIRTRVLTSVNIYDKLCYDYPDINTHEYDILYNVLLTLINEDMFKYTTKPTTKHNKNHTNNDDTAGTLNSKFRLHPTLIENILNNTHTQSHSNTHTTTTNKNESDTSSYQQQGHGSLLVCILILLKFSHACLYTPIHTVLTYLTPNENPPLSNTPHTRTSTTTDIIYILNTIKTLLLQLTSSHISSLPTTSIRVSKGHNSDGRFYEDIIGLVTIFNPSFYTTTTTSTASNNNNKIQYITSIDNFPITLKEKLIAIINHTHTHTNTAHSHNAISATDSTDSTTVTDYTTDTSISTNYTVIETLLLLLSTPEKSAGKESTPEKEDIAVIIINIIKDIWTHLLYITRDIITHDPEVLPLYFISCWHPLLHWEGQNYDPLMLSSGSFKVSSKSSNGNSNNKSSSYICENKMMFLSLYTSLLDSCINTTSNSSSSSNTNNKSANTNGTNTSRSSSSTSTSTDLNPVYKPKENKAQIIIQDRLRHAIKKLNNTYDYTSYIVIIMEGVLLHHTTTPTTTSTSNNTTHTTTHNIQHIQTKISYVCINICQLYLNPPLPIDITKSLDILYNSRIINLLLIMTKSIVDVQVAPVGSGGSEGGGISNYSVLYSRYVMYVIYMSMHLSMYVCAFEYMLACLVNTYAYMSSRI